MAPRQAESRMRLNSDGRAEHYEVAILARYGRSSLSPRGCRGCHLVRLTNSVGMGWRGQSFRACNRSPSGSEKLTEGRQRPDGSARNISRILRPRTEYRHSRFPLLGRRLLQPATGRFRAGRFGRATCCVHTPASRHAARCFDEYRGCNSDPINCSKMCGVV